MNRIPGEELDYYQDEDHVYERLMEEYRKHKKLIVAFDFDDTVFDFHKKGRTYKNVIKLLQDCKALGFVLTLFTDMYEGKREIALAYCAEHGITPDYINGTPAGMPFGHAGKPYYNILLDDRAGLRQAFRTLQLVVADIHLDAEEQ